eukprot:GHVS01083771.1.p1 GENE.GHVS01083771.1~~GHVS01083771.1.p1  ORF type:complete len:166 (+),score=12.79 GHVS01083771.1:106-603(+)
MSCYLLHTLWAILVRTLLEYFFFTLPHICVLLFVRFVKSVCIVCFFSSFSSFLLYGLPLRKQRWLRDPQLLFVCCLYPSRLPYCCLLCLLLGEPLRNNLAWTRAPTENGGKNTLGVNGINDMMLADGQNIAKKLLGNGEKDKKFSNAYAIAEGLLTSALLMRACR